MICPQLSRKAFLDTALILALLIAANWLLARDDPGWSKLSPSPYLLLPLLIGARYGFVPGLLAGLSAMIGVLLLQAQSEPATWREILAQQRYLLFSFPIVGGICGEVSQFLLRENQRLNLCNGNLAARLKKTDADNCQLREAKDDLERFIAARDGEVSTLDTELRRLYSVPLEDLPKSILLLMHRYARVSSAAIYLLEQNGGNLRRSAALGDPLHLPESLALEQNDLARLAWERRTLVALPEILQGEQRCDHLIASCMLDSSEQPFGLLLVSGMAFVAMNSRNIENLQMLTKWTAEILSLQLNARGKYRTVPGAENQRVFTPDFFEHVLQLASASYRDHNMPSSLLLIQDRSNGAGQSEFESIIMPMLRTGDYAAALDLPQANLAILLPLIGERGASICQNRILQHWRTAAPDLHLPGIERLSLSMIGSLREVVANLTRTGVAA